MPIRLIASLALTVLLQAGIGAQGAATPPVPRPAGCEGFKTLPLTLSDRLRDASTTPDPWPPAEHVPYPPLRERWPVDVSTATIVDDPSVAFSTDERLPPASIGQVRQRLTNYVVLPHVEWQHRYSHVGGLDQGGWVVTRDQCFTWTVRPGGLAWVVYPDGTAVYLICPQCLM